MTKLGRNVLGPNYVGLGRDKVAKWSKEGTGSWPAGTDLDFGDGLTARTVADVGKPSGPNPADPDGPLIEGSGLKGELWPLEDGENQMVRLPDRICRIVFIQPDNETYIVRLPPKDLVEQSEEENKADGSDYGFHKFYLRQLVPGSGLGDKLDNIDVLYSRIADYTFAHCK